MAEKLAAQGCLIYENTRVLDLTEKDNCTVTTAKAKVKAKKVFMATHTPT